MIGEKRMTEQELEVIKGEVEASCQCLIAVIDMCHEPNNGTLIMPDGKKLSVDNVYLYSGIIGLYKWSKDEP